METRNNVNRIKVTCKQCGERFIRNSNSQIFCSMRCKWKFWNDRKPRQGVKSYIKAAESRLIEPTVRQQQIIIGTLLGDGCLIKMPPNGLVRMSICHGAKQLDYLAWKHGELGLICHGRIIPYHKQYHLNTVSHPFLAKMYEMFYNSGRKAVTPDILALVDSLALCVWYLDDGSFNNNPHSRQAVICTEGFGQADTELIAEWFASRWNIYCHVLQYTSQGSFAKFPSTKYRIVINRSQTPKFFATIGKHVPACMSYKLPSSLSC